MRRRNLSPPVFLLPFLALFAMFFIFPFLYSLYISLFVNRMGANVFVGFNNYLQLLRDPNFWGSLKTVVYFGVLQVLLLQALTIFLALLLDSRYIRGQAFFRLVYFLPYAVPGVIAAIMWGFLYNPDMDPILNLFGLTAKPLQLLDSGTVLYGILNMVAWEWTGYTITIYFANLTSIPLDLYEAAELDGCSEAQVAWFIKLPLLRPTIVMNVVLSIIGALQLFSEPYVLSSLTTIPYNFTPNLDIFYTAFSYSNFNYAATMSTALAVISFAAALLVMYLSSRSEGREDRENARARSRASRRRLISVAAQTETGEV